MKGTIEFMMVKVNVNTVMKTNVNVVCEQFDSKLDARFPAAA